MQMRRLQKPCTMSYAFAGTMTFRVYLNAIQM